MIDVIEISGFTPGPSDVINRDIEMDRLRRDVEALRAENSMHATEVLCLRRELAGKAATEVLERVAATQSADPTTDDLSVCLAIEVADLEASNASLRREKAALVAPYRNADEKDWAEIDDRLGHGGHGQLWRAVFEEVRAALRSATEKGEST